RGNDSRNKMVDQYIAFISLVMPKTLFFENVYGFTTATKKNEESNTEAYSTYVVKKLNALGYDTAFELVDFSEFGVPQRRKRFILVGVLKGEAKNFFSEIRSQKSRFLKSKGLSATTSAEEAISDLEKRHGQIDSVDTPNF